MVEIFSKSVTMGPVWGDSYMFKKFGKKIWHAWKKILDLEIFRCTSTIANFYSCQLNSPWRSVSAKRVQKGKVAKVVFSDAASILG
jgi:hypothetical protein